MDLLVNWSEKLAKDTAPDEIGIAPLMTQAFIKGGSAREELFYNEEKGALGGFGPIETAAIFPWILKSLSVAAPILSAMLSATECIKNFLSIMKELLEIKKKQNSAAQEFLSVDRYAPLRRSIDAVSKELETAPISQDKRDLIVYRVICALLEEPDSAIKFVEQIGNKK